MAKQKLKNKPQNNTQKLIKRNNIVSLASQLQKHNVQYIILLSSTAKSIRSQKSHVTDNPTTPAPKWHEMLGLIKIHRCRINKENNTQNSVQLL